MTFGYTLIYVDDVPRTMDFYERAFGLARGFLHESHQYGEMATGPTKLGFVQHETARSHDFTYLPISPGNTPPGIEVGFVTDDVEAAFRTAVAAGAVAASSPTLKPWGQTVSYVRDCNGLLVEICSKM